MTWKIRWKKNIKESIKENIVIFSLLFSLKNNEENKRKREGQRGGKFYRALLLFTKASPLTSSSLVAMASHRRQLFQRPPLSLRPPSSVENLPFSGTRVPMDKVRSSNQILMD